MAWDVSGPVSQQPAVYGPRHQYALQIIPAFFSRILAPACALTQPRCLAEIRPAHARPRSAPTPTCPSLPPQPSEGTTLDNFGRLGLISKGARWDGWGREPRDQEGHACRRQSYGDVRWGCARMRARLVVFGALMAVTNCASQDFYVQVLVLPPLSACMRRVRGRVRGGGGGAHS